MNKFFIVIFSIIAIASLSACVTTAPGVQRGSGPYWESAQNQIPPEIDAECRVKAGLTADTTMSVVKSGALTALLGAATGAAIGAITKNPGAGAGIGALGGLVIGGVGGGVMATQQQATDYNACVELKRQQFLYQNQNNQRGGPGNAPPVPMPPRQR